MKKKLLYLLCAVVVMVGTFRAGTVFGAGASKPGSVGDPLVTLSYLESRLTEKGISSKTSYEKVTMKKNQILLLEDGSEVVLYSGNATVVGSKGLINLTGGELFQTGYSLVKYQIFLSPSDASGFKASSDISAYIKGSYTIK